MVSSLGDYHWSIYQINALGKLSDLCTPHPEYLKLFGDAIDGLALYSHHHDHEHDIRGNIVDSEHCNSCEHHKGND